MLKRNKFEIYALVFSVVIYMFGFAVMNIFHMPQWQINSAIRQIKEKSSEEWFDPYKNIPIKPAYKVVLFYI